MTVKGIAEKEVRADTALWPLRLVVAEDDLTRATQKRGDSLEKLREFLRDNGLSPEEGVLQGYRVTDAYADQYRPAGQVARRYVAEVTVLVRSGSPDKVLAASQ